MSSAAPLTLEIDCHSVAETLKQPGEDFVLLDCREQDEYDLVRIVGSQLLPMSQLAARAAELEPYRGQRIVVHCHHGGRSLQVAAWLRKQGYDKAQSMAGGIDKWSIEIDPALPRY